MFEYEQYILSQLVKFWEQEPYLILIQVMSQVESQNIFNNFKFWDFRRVIRITQPYMSNQTKHG